MLVPGFLAGDASLWVMAGLAGADRLPRRTASGIDFNVDCSDRALTARGAGRGHHREAGRRVALIGHSRGGHFAKALAHRRPDLVRGVVSLGAGLDTPFDI